MKGRQKHVNYLDPVLLSRLDNMELVARCAVEGFFSGLHPSPFHGFSVEYSDHRAYQYGDELKYLDWKMYSRSDKLYIKQFQQETNVNVYMLLDSSKSMSFADEGCVSKLDYGSYLTAAMCYMMLKQNDSVSLTLFDENIRQWIPPRSRSTHLHQILKVLNANKPQGRTNLASVLHDLAERTNRRGVVVLISDLLDDVEDIKSGLAHLKYLKHDVVVFHTLDRQEINLDYEDQIQFEDLESGEIARVFPKSIQKTYRENVQRYLDEVQAVTGVNEIGYVLLNTSESLSKALLAYLNLRNKMR